VKAVQSVGFTRTRPEKYIREKERSMESEAVFQINLSLILKKRRKTVPKKDQHV